MINHPGASRIQSHASSSFGMRGVGRSGRSSDEELFINTDYQNRNESYRISLTFLNEIHNFSNWCFHSDWSTRSTRLFFYWLIISLTLKRRIHGLFFSKPVEFEISLKFHPWPRTRIFNKTEKVIQPMKINLQIIPNSSMVIC